MQPLQLILASTSSTRAQLLSKLEVPFIQQAPAYDESSVPIKDPYKRARTHAVGKAKALSALGSDAVVIGSDQVAHLTDGTILSKPGSFHNAFNQLKMCSGRWVIFTSSICLRTADQWLVGSESYHIKYRLLNDDSLKDYLAKDRPFSSAGSIHAEGLGVSLLEDGRGRDINTLYGLPLMLLQDLLQQTAIDITDFK